MPGGTGGAPQQQRYVCGMMVILRMFAPLALHVRLSFMLRRRLKELQNYTIKEPKSGIVPSGQAVQCSEATSLPTADCCILRILK